MTSIDTAVNVLFYGYIACLLIGIHLAFADENPSNG